MKKVILYNFVTLLVIVGTVVGAMFFTNLPQTVYLDSIRNIYFDCLQFVQDDYVYKAKPGPCKLRNIEFDTILNHNVDGFRNPGRVEDYDVAVLGDSQAHGLGSNDDEIFSHLLEAKYHYKTINLAIGSYATQRELEAFRKYGTRAKYVTIQYTDNDFGENLASLSLSNADFKAQVESFWRDYVVRYYAVKATGYRRAVVDLAVKLRNLDFMSRASWHRSVDNRLVDREASAFAQILAKYRPILEGKRLIVFESSPWGLNSPRFEATFARELKNLGWLDFKLIDSSKVLDYSDHYFLDGHIKPIGHAKFAAAVAADIAEWETADPKIRNR